MDDASWRAMALCAPVRAAWVDLRRAGGISQHATCLRGLGPDALVEGEHARLRMRLELHHTGIFHDGDDAAEGMAPFPGTSGRPPAAAGAGTFAGAGRADAAHDAYRIPFIPFGLHAGR